MHAAYSFCLNGVCGCELKFLHINSYKKEIDCLPQVVRAFEKLFSIETPRYKLPCTTGSALVPRFSRRSQTRLAGGQKKRLDFERRA